MKKTITLSVRHPSLPKGRIDGFRWFWAYYVKGFKSDFHCQDCFIGRPYETFRREGAESGRDYELDAMDLFEYVYVCGVGSGPKASLAGKNFHFPLKYAAGQSVTSCTYNGYVITAENAAAVPIQPLPPGWNGRDLETTRCKNFQFAVGQFGYPQPNSEMGTHRA